MAQNREGNGADVVAADAVSAIQDGTCFRAQHEVLAGPRAGTPRYVLTDEIGSILLLWARRTAQPQRIHRDVISDRYLADQMAEFADLCGGKRRRDFAAHIGGCAFDNLQFFRLIWIFDAHVEHESI